MRDASGARRRMADGRVLAARARGAMLVAPMPDPSLTHAILACAALSAACWILSVLTHEHSWVDRIWSVAPVGYVAYFAWQSEWSPRLVVMTVLVTAWGVRLTFNYARKGGYAPGGEDYRWAELKKRMSPLAFQVFNVFFVAAFQNALLLALSLPAWAAAHADAPLGLLDGVLGALFLGLLSMETLADEQQWRFQEAKRAALARGETVEPPFVTTGLFRLSRHPNFFAEQAMWWALALLAVVAGSRAWAAIFAGPIVLVALFFGSTRFTEELSLRKYPSYADYQRRTSKLVPWWPRR
jgi:steroid 5-alpha reductase family enzyme